MEMNLKDKLMNIQQELKCNKGQYNDFGKYKYRSCEDILESTKPLLKKYECILTLNDTMEYIGERYYIKATATLADTKSGEMICNNAYAREEETKKGMDGSQITGTASSYARKYALNGLLAIDDTKDADTNEYKKQTTKEMITNEQKETIKSMFEPDIIKEILLNCKVAKLSDLTKEEAAEIIANGN